MTRDEEIKAAIVVTPDMIQFATARENQAAQQLGMELYNLVDFIHSLQPILLRHEAMLLCAAVLEMQPKLLGPNPAFLEVLADGAQKLIAAREQADDQPDQN
ncbi:hypothetical protein [Nostoc sp. WHI]|uniref:hypothetical protein n=1 Tax=Nostoc sp. WHI TaxID=2650611 RepID=UPI0018C5C5CB|nr:hypothetical protein [Nostoc sp. WHI]MBG1267767.1 hypothetical protein [Nostoc sp. WHI]